MYVGGRKRKRSSPSYNFLHLPPELIAYVCSFACGTLQALHEFASVSRQFFLAADYPLAQSGLIISVPDSSCVERYARRYPGMSGLYIYGAACINTFTSCSMLSNLRSLTITGVQNLSPKDKTTLGNVLYDSLPGLHSLSLDGLPLLCSRISLLRLPYIRNLSLTNCFITDQDILVIAKLTRLTFLNLSDNVSLGDDGITNIISSLSSLQVLSLQDCCRITDVGLSSLPKLQNLTKLELGGCSLITNETMRLAGKLPNLVSLDVSCIPNITDRGVRLLFSRGSKIRTLDLYECLRITDAALSIITRFMYYPEKLILGGCRGITDSGVELIIRSYKSDRTLTHLNLSACPFLTDQSVLNVLLGLSSLRYFYCGSCDGLTSSLISQLLLWECAKNLREIYVSGQGITSRCSDLMRSSPVWSRIWLPNKSPQYSADCTHNF